jgi:hypothetical protein
LKAKVMEESDHDDAIEWALGHIKYDYHEHLALAAKKFEGGRGGGGQQGKRIQVF